MPTEPGRTDRRPARRANALLGLGPTIVLVVALCTFLIGVVIVRKAITEHPFTYYSIDPAATADASPFVGLLSHVGVLLIWGAAAAGVLAGAFVARARGWRHALPLVAAGVGTAYLALDDLFMGHESLGEMVELHEDQIFGAYVVAAAVFLWRYRSFFRQHEWPLLALAAGTLGASLLLDQIASLLYSGSLNWLEDCLKLFGLAFLAAYLVRLSVRMLVDAYPLVTADEVGGDERPEDASAGALVAADSGRRGA
jgi:hypothetical protein